MRNLLSSIAATLFVLVVVVGSAPSPSSFSLYDACIPRNCTKGPKISFPFYLVDDQDPRCGYSSKFGIRCQGDYPIFQTSRSAYIVKNISDDGSSIQLANNSTLNATCPVPLLYFSFDDSGMNFTSDIGDLCFFYGCEDSSFPLNTINATRVLCKESFVAAAEIGNCTAMFNQSRRSCHNFVAAPFQVTRSQLDYLKQSTGEIDYEELLQDGFTLSTKLNCSRCRTSGGYCGYNSTQQSSLCYCKDRIDLVDCNDKGAQRNHFPLKLKLSIGLSSGIITILFLGGTLYCLRKRCWRLLFPNEEELLGNHVIEDFIKQHGSLTPKRFSYSEIKRMTRAFEEKVGQGGFGAVYKGKLPDGTLVAVKLLNSSKRNNGEEFINEVASISRTSHVNIVNLLGFCFEGRRRALIYEFMSNGSLDKFIHEEGAAETSLGWEKLYQIAVGIARGLEYLHRGCNTRILHFDIKPHNILLDDDLCPKISDFGLSKLCLNKESIVSMMAARGTAGYIAPEVFSRNFGGVSYKSDVYSYGMMLIEMVGGRNKFSMGGENSSEVYFSDRVYRLLEPRHDDLGLSGTEEENDVARKMIVVGLWCIQTDPSQRPSMSGVIEMLEGSIEAVQIPPKPHLFSAPKSTTMDSFPPLQ